MGSNVGPGLCRLSNDRCKPALPISTWNAKWDVNSGVPLRALTRWEVLNDNWTRTRCDKQVNQRKQPMTIPWFEYPRRVSDSAPEFSRFSDIKNLQPNQKNNSEPLESINPTTLRDYWTFCRCAVMTNFFALISSFWSLFFSRPGQDNRPLSVKSDGCGKTQTKMTPFYGLFWERCRDMS